MTADIQCPECASEEVACLSRDYLLFRCEVCGERFSEEDTELWDKSSRHRTRPRRYDDDD